MACVFELASVTRSSQAVLPIRYLFILPCSRSFVVLVVAQINSLPDLGNSIAMSWTYVVVAGVTCDQVAPLSIPLTHRVRSDDSTQNRRPVPCVSGSINSLRGWPVFEIVPEVVVNV